MVFATYIWQKKQQVTSSRLPVPAGYFPSPIRLPIPKLNLDLQELIKLWTARRRFSKKQFFPSDGSTDSNHVQLMF